MRTASLTARTARPKQCLDITPEVEEAVAGSGVREGLCSLFIRHTTAALAVGESGEGTAEDLLECAERMIPRMRFRHAHDPSHAPDHMASSVVGPGLLLPVARGRLELGTWQRVLLLEFNGPRERTVSVRVF